MFRRKSDQSIEVTRLSSLIDNGVEIVGDIMIKDGLRIDGHVQGEVRCRQDARGLLVLSERGSIQGSVKVYDAVINGTINGDVEVEHFLELQQELTTTENRIQAARRVYNGNVRDYNRRVESIPSNLVARAFGFARADYFEALEDPATIHAICEDYRAAETTDCALDRANRGTRSISCPLLVLWGERGHLESLYDVLAIWSDWADDVRGRALPCGHHLPEEAPDETYGALSSFFRA